MFWDLTLAEYLALKNQFNEQCIQELHGSAMICSVLANINRDEKKRRNPFTPSDFLSQAGNTQPVKKDNSKTAEEMLAGLKAIKSNIDVAVRPTPTKRRKTQK